MTVTDEEFQEYVQQNRDRIERMMEWEKNGHPPHHPHEGGPRGPGGCPPEGAPEGHPPHEGPHGHHDRPPYGCPPPYYGCPPPEHPPYGCPPPYYGCPPPEHPPYYGCPPPECPPYWHPPYGRPPMGYGPGMGFHDAEMHARRFAEDGRRHAEDAARTIFDVLSDPEVQKHLVSTGMELIQTMVAIADKAPLPDFAKKGYHDVQDSMQDAACRARNCGRRPPAGPPGPPAPPQDAPQKVEIAPDEDQGRRDIPDDVFKSCDE